MTTNRRWGSFLAAALTAVLAAPAALAQAPASGSFVLSQSTVNTGGATAVSPSFVLDGSVAQEATVGAAGSASFVLESGFWTSMSALEVLRVEGTGSGSGSAAAAGIACDVVFGTAGGDCLEQVTHGTAATVVASPAAGHRFDGWTGCDALATTVLPDDTCQLTLTESRTVTVALTHLASVGDRVWADLDGDGIQDGLEPGIDGVGVVLDDGGGLVLQATTAGGGFYGFADLPPGSYTVSVNPATLPPGVFPTFDADGVATPHTAVVALGDGDAPTGVDFGYQPLADLALSKQASAATFPASGTLLYTIEVRNLGPAAATDVVVTDLLPAGLTLVATVGCGEDPGGVPTCSLGDLPPGAVASYTIEVSGDPENLPTVVNTATVAAAEADPEPSNDAASAVVGATPIVEIPALGPAGVALLALLLAAAGGRLLRCRRLS